jgi:CRP-like cAMP-binding protein
MAPTPGGGQGRGVQPDEAAEHDQLGGAIRSYPRGAMLCEEGAPALFCYRVIAGAARRFHLLEDGRRRILGFYLPGDFVAVADACHYRFDVEAMNAMTVARYERIRFQDTPDTVLLEGVVKLLCAEVISAQTHMALLGRSTARERVATCLEELAVRMKAGREGPLTLDLPITHHDMADYLGLTLGSVSRVLRDLKRCGVISVEAGRRIRLCDRAALRDMVQHRPFGMTLASD